MGRSPCCDKTKVKRGPWSPEEDTALKNYVGKYGIGGNWITLPQKAGLNRCGKSCRLRWLNYLRPNIKHGSFTEEEDNIILTLYHSIGSRWSVIAARLPGRTDNDVKNYWNTKLKKKLSTTTRITTSLRPSPNPCNGVCMNITSNNVSLSETIYYENTNFLFNASTDPIEANEQYSRDEEYIGYNNFGSLLMPKEAYSSTSSFSKNNGENSVDMMEFGSGFIAFDDNLLSNFDFQEIMNLNYDDIFSYNSSTGHSRTMDY